MSGLTKEVSAKSAFSVATCTVLSLLLFGLSDAFAASVSSGWTITSYEDANEIVYSDEKIEVFDSNSNSLGFYKSDFLEQVEIDGSGKGDGIQNSGKYLHYDYSNTESYYLSDKSLGAYENELVPWTGYKPSVAVNPPLPKGTRIRFTNLGPDAVYNPVWVNELLLNTTFYADDKFSGVSGNRVDVYVGLQKVRDSVGTPESLWMQGTTISTEPPEPACTPTGISETICNGADDNCDNRIDEGCVTTAPNSTIPNNTAPPNSTTPPTPPPNNTIPPTYTTPKKGNTYCQYSTTTSATSQKIGSQAKYALGAPNAPYVGDCNVWSGYGYAWTPANWDIKANLTLAYSRTLNVSNFTIFGDYYMCWSKMWLRNSATGKKIQVFNNTDTNCISTHELNGNFSADTIILETCGWQWTSTDAVQMCGTANY